MSSYSSLSSSCNVVGDYHEDGCTQEQQWCSMQGSTKGECLSCDMDTIPKDEYCEYVNYKCGTCHSDDSDDKACDFKMPEECMKATGCKWHSSDIDCETSTTCKKDSWLSNAQCLPN